MMSILKTLHSKLSPFFKEKGFKSLGNCFYSINTDIAYCIEFCKPQDLVYVHFYIMPLYIPGECRYFNYGNRLNNLPMEKLPVLTSKADKETLDIWFKKLTDLLDSFVFPYFLKISSPQKLLAYITSEEPEIRQHLCCSDVFIDKLLTYTYLYVDDIVMYKKCKEVWRQAVLQTNVYTERVRGIFLAEISMLEANEKNSITFFEDVCQQTRFSLFKR